MSASDAGRPRVEVVRDRQRDFLANARREVDRRGLRDMVVVDCDCHHYESSSYPEITPYIDDPSIRGAFERYSPRVLANSLLPGNLGDRDLAGRIRREVRTETAPAGAADDTGGVHPVAAALLRSMRAMAIDYSILFPTPMLVLGTHPQSEIEVELSRAYNRWLLENVLPCSGAIKTMPYLPLSDPDASVRFIEEFGDRPGVVGFMVTALRYQPIHQNRFMKVFAALNERRLPLAFHSAPNWGERSFEQLNRFLGVHALGFPFYAMLQMTNWVLAGIAERFPDVKVVFMEAGVAWLTFMTARLDSEYLLRSSEAPLLRRLPSEYIKDCYFTSQPLESVAPRHLETIFDMFDARRRLLYASDYPHQDFDLPTRLHDIPFLDADAKRAVLGGNALELFGLEPVLLQDREASEARRVPG
jgi:hypothetical protein